MYRFAIERFTCCTFNKFLCFLFLLFSLSNTNDGWQFLELENETFSNLKSFRFEIQNLKFIWRWTIAAVYIQKVSTQIVHHQPRGNIFILQTKCHYCDEKKTRTNLPRNPAIKHLLDNQQSECIQHHQF